jgi:TonB-linked SusC/RagA family outer membrane protein
MIKKICPSNYCSNNYLLKFLLTMKLTLLLLCLTALQISASVYSQNTKVSLKDVQGNFGDIITAIEEQTAYKVFYKNEQIDLNRRVILTANSSTVSDLLTQALEGTELVYTLLDKIIVLSPKDALSAKLQFAIKGQVLDETGVGMPGVNIIEKGTTNGCITDIDGNFSITVTSDQSILVFSFVGYLQQEILIGTQTNLKVTLSPDLMKLDEVVVVGYGVQKKKLTTGATVQVKGENVERMKTMNVLDALKGQTPGVSIMSTSGQPGEGYKVSIRGLGTVGKATPLYIVDGVQTSDIGYLNNADIESIDVLKDAATAAIYGSRAANGVILVTTKKGKIGKPQITYDGYIGVQNLYKKMPYMNTKEYVTMMNEQFLNSGQAAPYPTDEAGIAALGEGTDWIDYFIDKNAPTQNHTLGVNGGTELAIYSLGFSYTDQVGIVGGKDKSDFKRYNVRINSEYKLWKDYIKFGQHLIYSNTAKKGINTNGLYDNILGSAYHATPLLEPYDEDGNAAPTGMTETSPVLYMKYNYNNLKKEDKLIGDAYLEIQPIKNLLFRSAFSMDFKSGSNRSHNPAYNIGFESVNSSSKVSQDLWTEKIFTWDNSLTYDLALNKHRINALVGMSAQKNVGDKMKSDKYELLIDKFDYAYLSNGTKLPGEANDISGEPYEKERLVSYFGRINYSFDEKYLLTAILRADGSSKFAKQNRWGYFPSVSAGWIVSNESFMKNIGLVNFLKVRASWGQNGNQAIDNFRYMATLTMEDGGYSFGNAEGKLTTGLYADKLPNPDLVWETSEQTNLGLDAYFLNNRLGLTIDYYTKKTKDWLVEAPIMDIMGADAPFINAGNVKNQGVELTLGFNDHIQDFTYGVSANIAYNKNEVTYIGTATGYLEGGANLLYTNAGDCFRAQAGEPIGYFYGLKTAGIFQTEQEVTDWAIQPGAQPGDIKFVDVSGPNNVPDGKIDDNDRTKIGDPNPDYIFGFSFNVGYKGFDFSMITNGALGHQIAMGFLHNFNSPSSNYHQVFLNRWHGEGTSNELPRLTNNTETNKNWMYINDLLIDDADYWKISTVTFGYDFKKLMKKIPVAQLRLYFTAQNLYTFTNYLGMDPEVGFGVEDDAKRNYSSGIDVGFYPHPRTYLFGINVQF